MRLALALVGLVLLVPAASACEGLSPGDQMLAADRSCTLAFILAAPDGLYFATAGHCIYVNETASNPDVGEFGVGAFHYLNPDTGNPTDGSPGEDFGLIRIHPETYDELNPKVCGWEGPTGLYEETPGSGGVKHWGHGLLFGDLGPTGQRRQGVALTNDNTAFYWTGAGVPGDSGSAVLADDGRALGVLTHVLVSPETNGGTHLLRGYELAAAGGFTNLRLVLADEDPVKVLQEVRANATGAPTARPTPTTNGTKAPTTSPTSPTPTSPGAPTPTTGASPAQGDSVQPAASVDGGGDEASKSVPPAPLGLVLVAVAAMLLVRRKRQG